jgi:hypothetical protein
VSSFHPPFGGRYAEQGADKGLADGSNAADFRDRTCFQQCPAAVDNRAMGWKVTRRKRIGNVCWHPLQPLAVCIRFRPFAQQ